MYLHNMPKTSLSNILIYDVLEINMTKVKSLETEPKNIKATLFISLAPSYPLSCLLCFYLLYLSLFQKVLHVAFLNPINNWKVFFISFHLLSKVPYCKGGTFIVKFEIYIRSFLEGTK